MNYLIKNIQIVNEGTTKIGDVLLKNGRIEKINNSIAAAHAVTEIDGTGKYLLPGAIDDQVHFREPGLTHKATIYTEAKAAVAGGVTGFMEMPNTVPPAFTQQLLEDKYAIAAETSLANYSFYMGTSNDNIEEVLKAASLNFEHVVKMEVFLKNLDDFQSMNTIYAQKFPHAVKPARHAFQVAKLPLDALIEITCTAAIA